METIMITVPLKDYEDGVSARAKLEVLKAFTLKSSYSVDKEHVASILGFELPRPEKPILVDREF